MQNLVLTGVSEETSLVNPGNTQICLVFNEGELKVPVGADTAQAVLTYFYQNNPDLMTPLMNEEAQEVPPEEEDSPAEEFHYHDYGDENAPIPTLNSDEDDGVSQV